MAKKIIISLMVFAVLLVFALPVLAQIENPLPGIESFSILFKKILDKVFPLVGLAGVFMIIVAGIFYMTSAGIPGRIDVAKKTLTYAIIGMAIGLGYEAIIAFIKSTTSYGGLSGIFENLKMQALLIVGPISAIMVIVAGIFYLTSAGSDEKMKKAKTALIYVVAGTAIALGATLIFSAIKSIVMGTI